MPAQFPVKVCPFCMVDARTDAASCTYCGSSYDRVALAAPRHDSARTRLRTYDGTPRGAREAGCVSLDLP